MDTVPFLFIDKFDGEHVERLLFKKIIHRTFIQKVRTSNPSLIVSVYWQRRRYLLH